eukprot:7844-Rhodomonas_salina.1
MQDPDSVWQKRAEKVAVSTRIWGLFHTLHQVVDPILHFVDELAKAPRSSVPHRANQLSLYGLGPYRTGRSGGIGAYLSALQFDHLLGLFWPQEVELKVVCDELLDRGAIPLRKVQAEVGCRAHEASASAPSMSREILLVREQGIRTRTCCCCTPKFKSRTAWSLRALARERRGFLVSPTASGVREHGEACVARDQTRTQ